VNGRTASTGPRSLKSAISTTGAGVFSTLGIAASADFSRAIASAGLTECASCASRSTRRYGLAE
jgi:hypothetical protein